MLKNKATQLDNEITQKDAIINFLTNQLLQTQSHKSLHRPKINDIITEPLKLRIMICTPSIIVKIQRLPETEVLYLRETNEKSNLLSVFICYVTGFPKIVDQKCHQVKGQYFPGRLTDTILEEMDSLITKKSDCLIHAGTHDLMKGISINYI